MPAEIVSLWLPDVTGARTRLRFGATDSIDDASAAVKTISRFSFSNMQHWIFADDFTEQLRYSIDRQWHAELPRTYFYDASHQMRAISGKLDAAATERWIKEQYRR